MTAASLADVVAAVARELTADHLAAWADVLEHSPAPSAEVEAALIDAYPGFALGAPAARLVGAWRREAPDLGGTGLALALRSAARLCAVHDAQRSTIVVSGPTSAAVPVRLTSEVALEVIRAARSSLLVVSFAAYGVAEVVEELTAAAERGVRIDLVLETTVSEGGALSGATGAAIVFQALEGKAAFWHWPVRQRPVRGRARAALHAKLIAADDRVAMLGSANLTDRALADNIEVGVMLRESDAVQRIMRHFRQLMAAGGPLEMLSTSR
jgi:phosphatidylserine/phosphatidylglycerophosphate/cardiolipin synthase-like enzyme